jgi:hypothetical protein
LLPLIFFLTQCGRAQGCKLKIAVPNIDHGDFKICSLLISICGFVVTFSGTPGVEMARNPGSSTGEDSRE